MRSFLIGMAVMAICAVLGTTLGMAAGEIVNVTQHRRTFAPGKITISQGTTVMFVNDDGELLHHAYAKSPEFSFDIGEQAPGSKMPVVFNKRGTFQVRCDIHPRMLLDVTVE